MRESRTEESTREAIRPPVHHARPRRPFYPDRPAPWSDEGVRRWHHSQSREHFPRLACIEPVAKGQLNPGTVVWAHVPFRELDDEKTRPAVVHSVRGRTVHLLAGSSSLTRRRYPDLYAEVADLAEAGLRRPTGVRRSVLFTVDLADVLSIAGQLADADAESVFAPFPRSVLLIPRSSSGSSGWARHAPG